MKHFTRWAFSASVLAYVGAGAACAQGTESSGAPQSSPATGGPAVAASPAIDPPPASSGDVPAITTTSEARPANQAERDIVITGSRLVRNGFNSPTPVTVLSSESLVKSAPTSLPDALNQMPQFLNSQSPATRTQVAVNTSVQVGNYLNLRGLNPQRTLVLLNGIRVPPSSFDGAVSVDTLPQALVQRVDVVTGGASAVYGSDAVVGVVNFVLDTKFEGLKGNAQYGVSTHGDNQTYRLSLAGGTSLLDGRLHVIGSVERNVNDGIPRLDARSLTKGNYCTVGSGTAASPFSVVGGCHALIATYGGVIPNSAAGSSVAALRGMMFLPNGTLAPFNSGAAGSGVGGDGTTLPRNQALIAPLKTWQTFGRASFDVSDQVHAFAQVSWAEAVNGPYHGGGANFTPGAQTAVTIYSGNAFLNPAIQALMGPNDFFQLGRYSDDEVAAAFGMRDIPNSTTKQVQKNTVVTAGLDGSFGKGWKWSASYTHGDARFSNDTLELSPAKWRAAVDAVRDPSGNIVCRVTITNPGLYPGCLPLNLFGLGAPSPAAVAWVRDTSKWRTTSKMDSGMVNLSGSPFSTWAGPVSVAVGGEYREQSLALVSNSDPAVPIDLPGVRPVPTIRYNTVNVGAFTGKVNVKEAFAETLIPLARDIRFLHSLDLNGAVRYTDYSTSGGVTTYKVGADYSPFADLRFRGTFSRDIRAPNLYELFAGQQRTPTTITDPHTGVSNSIPFFVSGNPNLTPEIGKTLTYGVVYRPSWLNGFGFSVDAYRIKITDAISAIPASVALSACEASNGTGPTCAQITRPLPFSDRSPANIPTAIAQQPVNLASITQKGVDFEATYRFSASTIVERVSGTFEIRAYASYLYKYLTDLGTNTPGSRQESAGFLQRPKWHGLISVSYDNDRFGLFVQERFTGSFRLETYRDVDTGLPSQVYADHGFAPNYGYTDVTLTYKFGKTSPVQAFVTVNNLFDVQAPLLMPAGVQTANLQYPTIRTAYDVVGRQITGGVRFRF